LASGTLLKTQGSIRKNIAALHSAWGLDRLAMVRWAMDDIRLMHSADLRS